MYFTRKCRVCLSGDKRMYAISNTVLQETWEKLTNARFNNDDGKPVIICYICCAQLKKSHEIINRALKAEELLTDFIKNGSELSEQLTLATASLSNDLNYNIIKPESYFIYKEIGTDPLEKIKMVYTDKDTKESDDEYESTNTEFKKERNTPTLRERIKDCVKANVDVKIEVNVENKELDKDIKGEVSKEESQEINKEDNERDDGNIYVCIKTEQEDSIDQFKECLGIDNSEKFSTHCYMPTANINTRKMQEKEMQISSEMLQPDTHIIQPKNIEVSQKVQPIKVSEKVRKKKRSSNAGNIKILKNNSKVCEENYRSYTNATDDQKFIYEVHLENVIPVIEEKSHKCNTCDTIFTDVNDLNKHIMNCIQKEKRYSCHMCIYKYDTEVDLTRHLLTHTKEKPHVCGLCDNRFTRKCDLNSHIKFKHTKEKQFPCNMCKRTFVTRAHLNIHLRTHTGEKPYACGLCDYRFSQEPNLINHIKYRHTKERNFSCHLCVRKFVTKANLMLHIRTHTGEKPYKCDLCGHRSTQKTNLKKHMQSVHIKERNFECHICERKFTRENNLNMHLRKHTGEKPYTCNVCDNKYGEKHILLRHIKLKHPRENECVELYIGAGTS